MFCFCTCEASAAESVNTLEGVLNSGKTLEVDVSCLLFQRSEDIVEGMCCCVCKYLDIHTKNL